MITTITGENSFLLKEAVGQRRRAFITAYTDLALERFDANETAYDIIKDALQSLPFLAAKKLVIIDNFSSNKELLEHIEHIFDTPEITDVILVDAKPDKRSKAYKTLKSKTEFVECPILDESQLAGWLVEQAHKGDGKLSSADARYLVQRVGTNQQLLFNELQKLLAFDTTITREAINELCEPLPQGSVFELLDAGFAGNQKRVLELYEQQRQQRVEPLAILGMIGWQLHILALTVAAKDKTPETIAKEAGVHPFVVRKSRNVATRLNLEIVRELVGKALKLDIQLKRQPLNADDALKQYLLSLATF